MPAAGSSRRGRWATRFGACLVLGCGARSSLDSPSRASRPDASAAGAPTHDASADAVPSLATEAGPTPGDAACSSPWVLFALTTIGSEGGITARQIYARRSDGTGSHVVALPHPYPVTPSVSPDGTALVYTVDTYDHIYVHRFTDGSDVELAISGTTLDPVLSPDGSRVAYDDGHSVWLAPTDGSSAPKLLVQGGAGPAGGVKRPVFTLDSKRVVFAATAAVESVALDGTDLRTVVSTPASATHDIPAFSPDGASILTSASCDGASYALRVFPVSSSPAGCGNSTVVLAVSSWAAEYSRPAWGPDGLVAYADETGDVIVTTVSGGAPATFTHDLTSGQIATATDPTFAPACTPL